jgi:hypothetical protein
MMTSISPSFGALELCQESLPKRLWLRRLTWRDFNTTINQQGAISAFLSTIMADNSLNSLLEILHDHDVPYNRDAIKSAFDSPESQTAILAWMEEYLSPETLLTKEEATL